MAVTITSLRKAYGKKIVLDSIDLEVPDNAFVLLSGASGTGKSTLLSIIGGIEPVTSGKILIDGQDVSKLKGRARTNFYRNKIGFIFQGGFLQPQLTISENIALAGFFTGMTLDARRKRSRELAENLGIEEVLDSLPLEISGGQAERACIARAIFMNPKIILADEPTNNLDHVNIQNVLELLKQLQQKMGVTVIIASHDDAVEKYASKVFYLKDRHVFTGET